MLKEHKESLFLMSVYCPTKRWLLILSLIPFSLLYPSSPWMFHWGFVVPSVSLAAWVWLYNFDKVVIALHKKPIYYEDLELPGPNPQRAKFQRIFLRLLGVCIAFLIGITVDFQMTTWKNSSYNWFAIMGLIGGVWNIVDKFEGYISNVLLLCINYARVHSPQLRGLDEIQIPALDLETVLS